MAIGRPVDEEKSHLEDYEILKGLQGEVGGMCKISVGMSGDYKDAIEAGSDYVRVGSKIFGARDYSQKKN